MIKTEVLGKVALLKLSRPEKLNSLNSEMLSSIIKSLHSFCSKGSLSVVTLLGEGRFFSAGIDLEEIANASNALEASKPFRLLVDTIKSILSCEKVVVSILNGPAVAGGAEIALSSDVVIATRRSWIQWPEISWNLVAPLLLTVLKSAISPRLAYIALSSGRIDAEEALRLGIVSEVVDSVEDAIEVTKSLAESVYMNREAMNVYLNNIRELKRYSVKAGESLISLAEKEDLIVRARNFLEKKRR